MSAFFIRTSQGIINRHQVNRVIFWRIGIEVYLTDNTSFTLKGEEAYLFVHCLTPSIGIGSPKHYEAFVQATTKPLEEKGAKIAQICLNNTEDKH